MARINLAKYNNELIDSLEVDDNYNIYNKEKFQCPECFVKVQFNRGINKFDPHFKNWPYIRHKNYCGIENLHSFQSHNDNKQKQILTSTILPRAERLQKFTSNDNKQKEIRRFLGRRSQIFLNALNSLQDQDFENLLIRTEDQKTIALTDLVLRQDKIVEKLNLNDKPFICILKGYTSKKIEFGNNTKIPLTFGGKYQNTHKFDIFIPSSFKNKNIDKFEQIENSLIYCYGLAEKNEYGYKIDVYSITHQIVTIQ